MGSLRLTKRADTLFEAFDDETLASISKMPIGKPFIATVDDGDTGSLSMLKTWRKWMAETSHYMAASGCTMPTYCDREGVAHGKRPFNENDAHELFTMRWLGSNEHGVRYSWSMSRKNPYAVVAPKGKRLFAMDRHLEWATERGIKLTIPNSGEYAKLQREQNQ